MATIVVTAGPRAILNPKIGCDAFIIQTDMSAAMQRSVTPRLTRDGLRTVHTWVSRYVAQREVQAPKSYARQQIYTGVYDFQTDLSER